MIEAALRECGGRVYGPSGAAAKLGIPRTTLETKIKSLKINSKRQSKPSVACIEFGDEVGEWIKNRCA